MARVNVILGRICKDSSTGKLIVPVRIMKECGYKIGDKFSVRVDNGEIIFTKVISEIVKVPGKNVELEFFPDGKIITRKINHKSDVE
jgi:bifunctional DNA-binding transcriptional regulator/antitoxin component of YhaV-PrlF toxin-antitoxin module